MLHWRRTYILLIVALACVSLFRFRKGQDVRGHTAAVWARARRRIPSHGGRISGKSAKVIEREQAFHILTVAPEPNINLCKTLFSGALLGYPPPTIIAWNQKSSEKQGAHLIKILRVLEWLKNLPPDRDNDLVMVMNGYDTWFQLPKNVLLERYSRIKDEANRQLRRRMGRAAKTEGIKQSILFAAEKRCYPNQVHTLACWPLPPSPLYKDMWEGNTDHPIGSFPTPFAATRQRFLKSALIVGPASDVRALFERAAQKAQDIGTARDGDDNGSGSSKNVYNHDEQAIFNMIFGEQEYQREVMRLRHMSWIRNPMSKMQQLLGKHPSDTDELLEGHPVGNILDPPWSHVEVPHMPGKPLEFGIFLDYWSQLAFATANAERNGAWLNFSELLEPQIQHTGRWDCKPHLEPTLPLDIVSQPLPFRSLSNDSSNSIATWLDHPRTQHQFSPYGPWERKQALKAQAKKAEAEAREKSKKAGKKIPPRKPKKLPLLDPTLPLRPWSSLDLYTNVCTGVTPALLHLNGDKSMRTANWTQMWYQPYAVRLASHLKMRRGLMLRNTTRTGGGERGEEMVVLRPPWEAIVDTGEIVDFANGECGAWDFK